LQGDLRVFIAQACVSFELVSYLRYFFPDLLLIAIPDMDDNDAR